MSDIKMINATNEMEYAVAYEAHQRNVFKEAYEKANLEYPNYVDNMMKEFGFRWFEQVQISRCRYDNTINTEYAKLLLNSYLLPDYISKWSDKDYEEYLYYQQYDVDDEDGYDDSYEHEHDGREFNEEELERCMWPS